MMQRHCAQVPPPPQAEAKKMPWAERVCSNLSPAATVIDFSGSSLILIVTAPELTNWARATRMIATKERTTAVNIKTPRVISLFIR